jgi:erythromycin esterase-like protein
MRVCASFNLGGNQWLERHDSIADALNAFRAHHDEIGFTTVWALNGDIIQQSTMDVSAQCADCTDRENHHDHPRARYVVGKHGGIKREVG